MEAPNPPLLSVEPKDGIWSVNERGPTRVAIAFFPSKWGALKHAVKVARAKGRARRGARARRRAQAQPRLRQLGPRIELRGGAVSAPSFALVVGLACVVAGALGFIGSFPVTKLL